MRAVRHTERGIEVVDAPSAAGDGVRVRVHSAGICQTDVNLCRAGALPQTFGHEFAGELVDGTPVAVEPALPCGSCEHCGSGRYEFCVLARTAILGLTADGGMAEEVVVPEHCLVPLPPGASPRDACLMEPLAVNLHGLEMARLRGGERVAVVGSGLTGFGLFGLAGARARGCTTFFDRGADHENAAAERLGATVVDDGLYDLVIEGGGTNESIARAISLCRPGGTLSLTAGYYDDKVLPTALPQMRELTMIWPTLYGHHAGGRDSDAAAALLARDPEIAHALITHRFPLEAAAEAFALVTADEPSLKVVLEP